MEYKFKPKCSSLSNSTNCSNTHNQSIIPHCFNETRIFETIQIDHSFNFNMFIGDKHNALQTMDYLESDYKNASDNSDESAITFRTVNELKM